VSTKYNEGDIYIEEDIDMLHRVKRIFVGICL